MNRLLTFLAIGVLFLPALLFAQANVLMVTYGPAAPTYEGDDDFKQIIFLQIPESATDSLYLRIFDMDCGNDHDLALGGNWDTQTRFALYGGAGAYSSATAQSPFPNLQDLNAGVLIKNETVGENALRNNEWHTFARFLPGAGEKIGGQYYFKLVVQGVKGNDANVFDVRLSQSDSQNKMPDGVRIFTYAPTIRLRKEDPFASVKFFIPENLPRVVVYNFDLAGAAVSFETALRSNLLMTSSGQGEWVKNQVALEKLESGRLGAISFGQGGETPNDATFYVTQTGVADEAGKALAIELPILLGKPNRRPVIQKKILALSDCYSIVFDAKGSTDADGDVLEYFWEFGDGEKAQGSRIVHRYAEQKRYEAQLIVTDNSGQVGNSTVERFPVVVNKPPQAAAGADVVAALGDAVKFDGSASSDQDGTLQRFIWDFGNNKSAEGVTTSHLYASPGTYRVSLRVEDNSDSPCNFSTDELSVWINAAPQAEAGANVVSSAGKEIRFDGSGSSDADGEIASYAWDFGDGEEASGKIVNHIYKKPGKYIATLTIKDNANVRNSTASDQLTVVINYPPAARAGNDALIAKDETLNFDASGSFDQDGQIISYRWDFGDGASASGARASHSYAAPGKYKVTLTVKDNSGTDSDTVSDTMMVTVNAQPIANAGENQIVTASEVKFDGTASKDADGRITRYQWDFGDGSSGEGEAPAHVYSKTGTYTVKLTVTDDTKTKNNKAASEIKVVVNEKPIADAGPDQTAAINQEISLSAGKSLDPDGQIARYTWDFGDGSSGEGKDVTHRYAKPGIYTARLTVQDNTGQPNAVDFDEAIITVNAPPVAKAGNHVIAAPNQQISFDGKGSYDLDGKIILQRWDFSDGKAGVEAAQTSRTFSAPGVYSATLTVKDNSGAANATARDTIFIRINNSPIAKAGKDIFTCENTLAFDASASSDPDGNPLSYYWNFGDGTPPDSGVKVVHQFAKGGAYPVVLTVDDGLGLSNSRHSTSITVKINQPPVANAGENRIVCANEVVLFNAAASRDPEGGLLKYNWDFGDGLPGQGNSADGLNPTKIYKTAGVYQVKLTVTDDSGLPCNTATDTKIIRVVESPVADAGPDFNVCANTQFQFDGTKSRDFDGVVNSYFWDFGDGTTGGGATPIKAYTRAGTYRVVLTVTGDQAGDCDNTDTDDLIVTVHEAPVAQFTSPAAAPLRQAVSFDASASISQGAAIVAYEWNFGDGKTSSGKTVTHTYDRAGKFTVLLTIKTAAQTSCNTTTAQRIITINAAPVANAGSDQLVGVNQTLSFNGSASKDADGSITGFHWNFGDGQTASGPQVRHQFQKSGRFPVILRVTDDTDLANNSAVDTAFVTVNAAPKAVISAKAQACVGEQVSFSGENSSDADGKIARYAWDFGDGSSGEGARVTHVYNKSGLYHVTLTVDDGTATSNSNADFTAKLLVNQPPAAVAGADRIICPGAEVTFDASASVDPDGQIKTYKWNLGDGSEKEGKLVQHVYQKAGAYRVRLTVFDQTATSCAAHSDTLVVIVNSAPTANAGPDREGFVGGAHDAILFDGTQSSDPDGDPLTYSWDFGDGTTEPGAKAFHYFVKPGRYVVRLKVNDGKGTACSTAVDEMMVEVKERDGSLKTKKN
jgi:PKD repeat protein